MPIYPEDKYAALSAAIAAELNNQPELEEYLLEFFYAAKDRELMEPILSPDRTYPTIRA